MRISEKLSTNRLVIRKAIEDDINELNRICASWDDKAYLEGNEFPKGYIEDCMKNGDLPPIENADSSNYYMMTIQRLDGTVVGFVDLYHGYPDDYTVWISTFLIDKQIRGYSYGQEAIQSITKECSKRGWKSVGLGVYSKNLKGLRFWYRNGFNKIIGIYGDKEYSERTFSFLTLRKELV